MLFRSRKIDESTENEYLQGIFDKMMANRAAVSGNDVDIDKSAGFTADGFTNLNEYYESNFVELLTFYGDIYDDSEKKFHKNRVITIVDRAYVIYNEQNPSWLGKSPIYHAGWRERHL